MKVFIIGASNLLGSYLLRFAPKDIELGASYNVNTLVPNVHCKYFFLDITKQKTIDEAFKTFRPEVVIHTAAISSPDYCDKHKAQSIKVNVEGTKNVIKLCKKYTSSFIFISSNGVYDGKNSPYDESVIPKPIDIYGKTKYQGELLTASSGLPFIIIRLNTMYGWNNPYERQNPATWVLESLEKDKIPLYVVTDLFNNFLFAQEAALAIWKTIVLRKFGESFNIAGKECISRFDFAQEVSSVFNKDTSKIIKVSSSFFKNHVARPKNTCFITQKMQTDLGIKPISIRKGLLTMRKRMLKSSDWKKL